MSRHRYAIWVRLDAATERLVADVIERLADEFSAPRFVPHVTLMSGFRTILMARAKAEEAAARSVDPALELGPVRSGGDFFRAAFLSLTPASNARFLAGLAGVGRDARSEPIPPHVSLVYTTPSAQVLQRAERWAAALVGRSAQFRRLELWQLNGAVEAWRLADEPIELSFGSDRTIP